MSSKVSVPEKTLEHWTSQYINYRYRSKAGLWWPARGEDINVGWLPKVPGKAVQIELKTTIVDDRKPDLHDVKVDLGQLWEYERRPIGRQPFYVLPRPGWRGTLENEASRTGRAVTELGYSRSGELWWFADWMIVLTTSEVCRVLSAELAGHGKRDRGKSARLVRYDVTTPPGTETWGQTGAVIPGWTTWLDFWWVLERCGRSEWPQLIRLPARLIAHSRYSYESVQSMVREVSRLLSTGQWDRHEELVTLAPDGEGGYVIEGSGQGSERPLATDHDLEQMTDTGSQDHRQLVFLDASALNT